MPMKTHACDHLGELLLGFDAHLCPSTSGGVASVDELIWPSAWVMDSAFWTGPVQGLWDSFERMNNALLAVPGSWWLVAIYVELDGAQVEAYDAWAPRCSDIDPAAPIGSAIGYDVADFFLTSGIVRYRARAPQAREHASGRLNALGLLDDRQGAKLARAWCDNDNPGHAPHYVFRIELIRKQTVAGNEITIGSNGVTASTV